jgi:hypothetical protein
MKTLKDYNIYIINIMITGNANTRTEQSILDFANKAVHFINNNNNNNNNNNTVELYELLDLYHDLCCDILDSENTTSEKVKEFMFSIVYRLIYFINDLTNQYATETNTPPNYALTYRMIHELNCVFDADFYQPLLKQLAKNAIADIIQINVPVDCWRELPHLLHYIYHNNDRYTPDEEDAEFYDYIIDIIVTRLLIDSVKIKLEMQPSTLAFWLPKEKSKQLGYLTHDISYHLYSTWIKTAEHPVSLDRAKTKCLTHYRKLITELKSHLDVESLRLQKSSYQQLETQTQSQSQTPVRSVLSTALVSTVEAVQSIVQKYCSKPKNKYTSYSHLLSDLCKESFIIIREEMSELWETILYGDMPGLIDAGQQASEAEHASEAEVKTEAEAEIEAEIEAETEAEAEASEAEQEETFIDVKPVVEQTNGWFSWFFNKSAILN